MILISNLWEHGLLTNLSEAGYLQLKKDRESISDNIKQLESIIDHFDLALESLESIYNPQVDIYKLNTEYWGRMVINHPDLNEDNSIEFLIGDIKTNSDPENLKTLSKQKARDEVKKLYPLYFLNNG
jgi:hypothetical protein